MLEQLIQEKIWDAIDSVEHWVTNGYTVEDALQKVLSASTLGPKSQAQVRQATENMDAEQIRKDAVTAEEQYQSMLNTYFS